MGVQLTASERDAVTRYRELIPGESPFPLFFQPWWLDAVCDLGQWRVVVRENGGKLTAAMPYRLTRRLGMNFITMPPLTQFLGPWVAPLPGKYATRLGREKGLIGELIESIPEFDYFNVNLSSEVSNWLPFYWRGFTQTTYYSYVLDDLVGEQRVWSGMEDKLRSEIRKGQKSITVRDDGVVAELEVMLEATYSRQGLPLPIPREVLRQVWEACQRRRCGRIYIAEDKEGGLCAGALIVWDSDCAYYLVGGSDPQARRTGAGSVVVWEAIRAAREHARRFDFEGSMVEPIERFFRSFGAVQRPYSNIRKITPRAAALVGARRRWLRLRKRI